MLLFSLFSKYLHESDKDTNRYISLAGISFYINFPEETEALLNGLVKRYLRSQ